MENDLLNDVSPSRVRKRRLGCAILILILISGAIAAESAKVYLDMKLASYETMDDETYAPDLRMDLTWIFATRAASTTSDG